jgi:hypothetical protein
MTTFRGLLQFRVQWWYRKPILPMAHPVLPQCIQTIQHLGVLIARCYP